MSQKFLTSEAAIDYSQVSRRFRSRRGQSIVALDDITFTVAQQEFVSVVGPSGCGKTTLLRITAGLVKPSSGSIRIGGAPVTGPTPLAGIMFQSPVLLPWRTVLKNVLLPVELTGRVTQPARERARDLVDLVGLTAFSDHLPNELSGGMQQRVALARALLHDPAVLLLDEPFGALDALTREEMNAELMSVWDQRKKTALLVTHSIPEAVFLSDRVVVMSAHPGRIKAVYKIDLPRPRDPAVKYEQQFSALAAEITSCLTQGRSARTAPSSAQY